VTRDRARRDERTRRSSWAPPATRSSEPYSLSCSMRPGSRSPGPEGRDEGCQGQQGVEGLEGRREEDEARTGQPGREARSDEAAHRVADEMDGTVVRAELEPGVDGPPDPVLGPRRHEVGAAAAVPRISRSHDRITLARQGVGDAPELTGLARKAVEEEDGLLRPRRVQSVGPRRLDEPRPGRGIQHPLDSSHRPMIGQAGRSRNREWQPPARTARAARRGRLRPPHNARDQGMK
jgi:hypothetical protein